jgi:Glycosyl hydrolases family 2, TIM barrel domain
LGGGPVAKNTATDITGGYASEDKVVGNNTAHTAHGRDSRTDAHAPPAYFPRRGRAFGVVVLAALLATLLFAGPSLRSNVTIVGGPGSYQLLVNGTPFYVRGVAFSPGGLFGEDAPMLSPAQLRSEFRAMHRMGANTIRIYSVTPDTPHIMTEAWQAGLMVLMGYWLDHDTDYVSDTRRLASYRESIRAWVLRYRTNPAVLMWVIGNETWGQLKFEFRNPRDLAAERAAYYRFVNEMAEMVKKLDPHHPVMTVDEDIPGVRWTYDRSDHLVTTIDENIPGQLDQSLAMFRALAPEVDVFGVNCYFPEDISSLEQTIQQAHIGRPYLVSEFGPAGYWVPRVTVDALGQPVEPTDPEKAAAYKDNWRRYVLANRGWNLGGDAFVWKDRSEGSFTWFGLTDSRDRLKPAYWALREAWTGAAAPATQPVVTALSINKRWMRPAESFVVRTSLAALTLTPDHYLYTYLIAPVTMTYVVSQFTTDLPEVSLYAPGLPGTYRVYVYVTAKDRPWVSTGTAIFGVLEPSQ